MELTLQHTTDDSTDETTKTRLYGVSDFQINHNEDTTNTVTVFWKPSAPLDEVEFQAKVSVGGEITQELLNDLLINDVNKNHVIVLGGTNARMLRETVAELPPQDKENITVLQHGDEIKPESLNIPVTGI